MLHMSFFRREICCYRCGRRLSFAMCKAGSGWLGWDLLKSQSRAILDAASGIHLEWPYTWNEAYNSSIERILRATGTPFDRLRNYPAVFRFRVGHRVRLEKIHE